MEALSGDINAFAPTKPEIPSGDAPVQPVKLKSNTRIPAAAPPPEQPSLTANVGGNGAPQPEGEAAPPPAPEAAPSWLDQPKEPADEIPDWLNQPKEKEVPAPQSSFKPVVDTNVKVAQATAPEKKIFNPDQEEPGVDTFLGEFKTGLGIGAQTSTTGLKLRGKLPDKILPEQAPLAMMIGSQIAQFAGDLPAMAPGLVVTGESLGLAAVPGLALAGALPASIRKHLMDQYSKGAATTSSEVVSRLAADAYEGAKGAAGNAAMAVGGPAAKLAGPFVGKIGADIVSKTAELAAMTAVSSAMEQKMPSMNDISSAAIVMAGTHLILGGGAAHPNTENSILEGKIQNIHSSTGEIPHDLVERVQNDPIAVQDMVAGNMQTPPEAAPTKMSHDTVTEPSTVEGEAPKVVGTKTTLEPMTEDELFGYKDHIEPEAPTLDADALHVLSHIGEQGEKPTVLGSAKDKLSQGDLAGAAKTIMEGIRKASDDFYTDNGNNLNPYNRMIEKAIQNGAEVKPESDPRSIAANQKSWRERADYFATKGTIDAATGEVNGEGLNSILGTIKNIGGSREEFTALTLAQSVVEKYDRAANNYTPYELPEGFDINAARRAVKTLTPKYEATMQRLGAFNDRVIDYAQGKGLISQDQAQRIIDSRDVYSPTHRAFEFDDFDNTELQPGSAPIKKVQGGSSEKFLDPITQTYLNLQKTIKAAEVNYTKKVGIDVAYEGNLIAKPGEDTEGKLLREVPDSFKKVTISGEELANILSKNQGLETIKTPERMIAELRNQGYTVPMDATSGLQKAIEGSKIRFDPSDVFTLVKRDPTFEKGKFSYRENGELKFFEGEPKLVEAMRSLDGTPDIMGRAMKIAAKAADMVRYNVAQNPITGPAFATFHNIKAMTMATINTKSGTFFPLEWCRSLSTTWGESGELFDSFLRSGAAIRTVDALNERFIEKSNVFVNPPGEESLSKPWNMISDTGKAAYHFPEASIRFGNLNAQYTEFRLSKAAGLSDLEAAANARNILPDYQMVGLQGSILRKIVPFSGAHINSTINMANNISRPDVAFRLATMAAMTSALWYTNRGDPAIENRPDWEKDTMWMMNPTRWEKNLAHFIDPSKPAYNMKNTDQEATVLKIPKPFTLGIMVASGMEHLLSQFADENPRSLKHFAQELALGILPSIVLAAAKPVMEQFNNRNSFNGQPIVPVYKEKVLPEEQMKPYTSETAKLIGNAIGYVPGLRDIGPKDVKLASPLVVENYAKSLGMDYILKMTDAALRGGKAAIGGAGPEKSIEAMWGTSPWEKTDVWARAVAHYPDFNDQRITDIYDKHQETERLRKTYEAKEQNNPLEAEKFAADHPEMGLDLTDETKELAQIRQAYRNVDENKDFSRSDKQQMQTKLLYDYMNVGKQGQQKVSDFHKELKDTKMAGGE